jgi:hypothetical protein
MTPRSRPRHEGFPVYNGIIPDFWTMQTSCHTLEPFQCRLEVFDNLRSGAWLAVYRIRYGSVSCVPESLAPGSVNAANSCRDELAVSIPSPQHLSGIHWYPQKLPGSAITGTTVPLVSGT